MPEPSPRKADVVMLTRNSMRPSLPETLASVYANVPVNRLIVVDGGSSDGTLEFVAKQKGAVVIDDSGGTRATARQKGVEAVATEFFAFVDSDVIVQKDWFASAMVWFSPYVGGVATFTFQRGADADTQRALARLYRLKSVNDLASRKRFDTAAAVIRAEAVRGVKIPKELQAGEDEFIGRFIQQRGFRAIVVPHPVVYDQRTRPQTDSPVTRGRLLRRQGWRTVRYMVRQALLSIFEGAFIWLYTGNFRAGRQRVGYSVLALMGYLS